MHSLELAQWSLRLHSFKAESHQIFSVIESAKSRKVTLDQSYALLSGLSLQQDDFFRQALRCVESELFRAAHVMAWAGLIDCLQSLVSSDGFTKLNVARPNWAVVSIEQLAEKFTEYALVEACAKIGLIGKAETKALLGMLSKRNECAHPGSYFPSYNETLGYIAEAFSRISSLLKRYPNLVI
jgi:hypothetical protein